MKRFTEFKTNTVKKVNEQEVTNDPVEVKQEVVKSEVSTFFSKLFEVRQIAHIFHLQVNGQMGSGWEHDALNEFYTSILEFTDEIIEVYQGQYGIVEGYEVIDPSVKNDKTSLEYLKENVEYIKKERKAISSEDTHIHNLIDEVIALFYKTIYKLTYTK